MPNFNCNCSDSFYYSETLADLRESMMIDLGYASQIANPPPGIIAMIDNWLRTSQQFLFRKFPALEMRRFYSWTLDPANGGERFYGIRENDEACTKRLDKYNVEGAWVEDLNGVWLPLVAGIPGSFYTAVNYQGIPSRYEVRQCIEIFPAPAEAYTLWIKGLFGLRQLVEETDTTTIDSELVRLWALARGKKHYGHPDAKDVAFEAREYLGTLVAGTHGTKRYIPGVELAPPLPQPLFLPLVP